MWKLRRDRGEITAEKFSMYSRKLTQEKVKDIFSGKGDVYTKP